MLLPWINRRKLAFHRIGHADHCRTTEHRVRIRACFVHAAHRLHDFQLVGNSKTGGIDAGRGRLAPSGDMTKPSRLSVTTMSALRRGKPLVALGALVVGCAQNVRQRPSLPETSRADAGPERVDPLVVTPGEALTIDELLARADQRLEAGELDPALADYERLLHVARLRGGDARDATRQRWFLRALFGAGTALDWMGDRHGALEHYLEVERRFPDTREGRTAGVRAVRLLVHLDRMEEGAKLAQQLLEATSGGSRAGVGGSTSRSTELDPLEEVALLGALALERIGRDDDVEALGLVSRGQRIVEEHGFDRADRLSRDLAQLYFALGEVRRLRAERIHFEPPLSDFPERLERRCQLLLDAQSAYSNAMRAHDAHWSARAGYRVGELYQKLHEAVMKVPPPDAAQSEGRRALFEGAMRLRYSVLLRKASTMLAHTLAMVERTGYSAQWVDKLHAARRSVDQALEAEEAALKRLPYTRDELEAALDHLRARGTPPPTAPAHPGPVQQPPPSVEREGSEPSLH